MTAAARVDAPLRRVAVVGCGIGGMAAAILLARGGVSVDLFERFETPRPLGAGFLLQPTGMGVLAEIGAFEPVRAAGAPIARLRGETIRGRLIMDLPYADYDPGFYGLGVHRGVVFEALFAALRQSEGVRLRTGGEIVAVDAAAGLLTLAPDEAAGRVDETVGPYDMIVAADGVNSALRRAVGAVRRDRAYEWACVWIIAPDTGGLLEGADAETLDQRYDGTTRFAGVLPIGRPPAGLDAPSTPHAALFWSLRADAHAAWRDAGADAWKAELSAFWPRFAALADPLEDLGALTLATYRDVVLARPYADRIAFIGDAAHAMSPQLGQGANLALLDALALSRAAALGRGVDATLRAYAGARRRQTGWYQRASRWLTPVFQSSNPIWGWARDLGFNAVSRIPLARREMLAGQSGMKTGYLTRDRRVWRPGRPAPDDQGVAPTPPQPRPTSAQ